MEADLGLAATIFLVALDRTIDNAASSLMSFLEEQSWIPKALGQTNNFTDAKGPG